MKPAWDKLMAEFEGKPGALVADVDCTAEGKQLCEDQGVEGFPTIKWGDPASLEDYEGGRDYEELSAFATENLKPICSPANLDPCSAEKKAQIEEIQKMSADELETKIKAEEQKLADAQTTFEKEVEELQTKYEQLEKDKIATIKEIKDSGLGLMKAVAAQSAKKEEL